MLGWPNAEFGLGHPARQVRIRIAKLAFENLARGDGFSFVLGRRRAGSLLCRSRALHLVRCLGSGRGLARVRGDIGGSPSRRGAFQVGDKRRLTNWGADSPSSVTAPCSNSLRDPASLVTADQQTKAFLSMLQAVSTVSGCAVDFPLARSTQRVWLPKA